MNITQAKRDLLRAAASGRSPESVSLAEFVAIVQGQLERDVSSIAKLTLQRNLHEQAALANKQESEKQGRIRASIQEALEKERERYRSDLAYYKAEEGYSNANNTLKYHLGQIEKELSPMARLALAQILAMSDEWLHSPEDDS